MSATVPSAYDGVSHTAYVGEVVLTALFYVWDATEAQKIYRIIPCHAGVLSQSQSSNPGFELPNLPSTFVPYNQDTRGPVTKRVVSLWIRQIP